jgi:hypothetical protein
VWLLSALSRTFSHFAFALAPFQSIALAQASTAAQKIIGDLSNEERVLVGLDIREKPDKI